MSTWFTIVSCVCLIVVLSGCVAGSGSPSTPVPPLPTRANQPESTPLTIVTSEAQPVSTSAPLRSITPVASTPVPPDVAPTRTVAPLPPAPQGANGIEGRVFIGPICPVVRADQPCPDKPYQASFIVLNASRAEVKRFETDAEGRFRVELPPGSYVLVPQTTGRFPVAAEQAVRVQSGQFAAVTITFDSGIR